MKTTCSNTLAAAAALLLLVASAGQGQAGLLTFEDVPGGSIQLSQGDMPDYQGFFFSTQLDWIDLTGPPSYGANFGAHSGQFGLRRIPGGITEIRSVGDIEFTFDGLWAKKWATAPESGGVDDLFGTLSGTLNNQPVWSVNTSLNGSYEFYGPQAGAIDRLELSFGDEFLVDDISLNFVSASVPEPSSIIVFGIGALGMAFVAAVRRRRKNSTVTT